MTSITCDRTNKASNAKSSSSTRGEGRERYSSSNRPSPRGKASCSNHHKESFRFPGNRSRSLPNNTFERSHSPLTIEDIGWGPLTIEDIGWGNVEDSRRKEPRKPRSQGYSISSKSLRKGFTGQNDAPLKQQQIQEGTRTATNKSYIHESSSSRNLMAGAVGSTRISQPQRMRRAVSLRDVRTKDSARTQSSSKPTSPKEEDGTKGSSSATDCNYQAISWRRRTYRSRMASSTEKKKISQSPKIVIPCSDLPPEMRSRKERTKVLDSDAAHSDLASLEFGLDTMIPSSQLPTWASSA